MEGSFSWMGLEFWPRKELNNVPGYLSRDASTARRVRLFRLIQNVVIKMETGIAATHVNTFSGILS